MKIRLLIFLIIITITKSIAMSDNDVKNYMKRYIEAKTNSPVSQIDIISSYPVARCTRLEGLFFINKS